MEQTPLGALGSRYILRVLFSFHLDEVKEYSSYGSDMLTQLC